MLPSSSASSADEVMVHVVSGEGGAPAPLPLAPPPLVVVPGRGASASRSGWGSASLRGSGRAAPTALSASPSSADPAFRQATTRSSTSPSTSAYACVRVWVCVGVRVCAGGVGVAPWVELWGGARRERGPHDPPTLVSAHTPTCFSSMGRGSAARSCSRSRSPGLHARMHGGVGGREGGPQSWGQRARGGDGVAAGGGALPNQPPSPPPPAPSHLLQQRGQRVQRPQRHARPQRQQVPRRPQQRQQLVPRLRRRGWLVQRAQRQAGAAAIALPPGLRTDEGGRSRGCHRPLLRVHRGQGVGERQGGVCSAKSAKKQEGGASARYLARARLL